MTNVTAQVDKYHHFITSHAFERDAQSKQKDFNIRIVLHLEGLKLLPMSWKVALTNSNLPIPCGADLEVDGAACVPTRINCDDLWPQQIQGVN